MTAVLKQSPIWLDRILYVYMRTCLNGRAIYLREPAMFSVNYDWFFEQTGRQKMVNLLNAMSCRLSAFTLPIPRCLFTEMEEDQEAYICEESY